MAALKGLYNAVWNNDTTTLILSPTQRQSGILFRRMKTFLNKNSHMPEEVRIPINEMIVRETQTVIELENGSVIYSLPASEDGQNVRGFVAHWVEIDEAGYVQEPVYAAIKPMLITTKGTLLLLGTPNGVNNYFYKAYSSPDMGFNVYHFPSRISPMISEEDLESEKKSLPMLEYRQEFEGEFIESRGVIFPKETIEKIIRKDCPFRQAPLNREDFSYILGYDPARFGEDEAVGCILEKRTEMKTGLKTHPYAVVNMFEMKKKSLADQIEFLRHLHSNWKFSRMIIDETGMGGAITDTLLKENYPVEGFTFTFKSKQEVYFNLLKLMEGEEIIIPPLEKLIKQMLDLKREDRSDGYTLISHPRHGKDDYPTALVLASWAGAKQKTADVLFGRGRGVFT